LEGIILSLIISLFSLSHSSETEKFRRSSASKSCLEAPAAEEAATPQPNLKLSMSLEFEAGTFGKLILEKTRNEVESEKAQTKLAAGLASRI
jgi:hypothetical protein